MFGIMTSLFLQAQNLIPLPDGGISYKIFSGNSGKPKMQVGDAFGFDLVVKNDKDSLIQSTYDRPQGSIRDFELRPGSNPADIARLFPMLTEGDSLVAEVAVDSVQAYSKVQIPAFFAPGTVIKYFFKINQITTKSQQEAMQGQQREKESTDILNYLTERNIEAMPQASG